MAAILSFLALLILGSAQSSSLITFQNKQQLDDLGKVFLGWEYDEASKVITFELEAETLGYVGLGISPTGSMIGADIFISGVYPNGTIYTGDYHADSFTKPMLDASQDCILINALEQSNKTFLKFSRKINTCDSDDFPIGNDTTRVIWALGETDEIVYHGPSSRGMRSLNLVGPPMPPLDMEGLLRWEITLENEMPKQDTSYWCSFFKSPVLNSKHHVVAFDALLDGLHAKAHTHHFILYNCYAPSGGNETLDEIFRNYTVDTGFLGGQCFDPSEDAVPMPVHYCTEYLFVWAKGGKMMTFPENVGYAIGDGENAGKQLYHMLEIHYDNPEELEGVSFRTGVQYYYTNQTRQEDAGLLTVGHGTDIMLTVPPNVTDFVIVGHCTPDCTEWGLPEQGVTIFNVLLHAHMSGRRLKLRWFRDGVELPWIDNDDRYDFDYQQNKPIDPTVLLPGDQLIYECYYDSTWHNGAVVGGLSSREEMCETFLWYYPRQDMDMCMSFYPFENFQKMFGITEVHAEPAVGQQIIVIDEPAYLRGPYRESINKFNWTDQFIMDYQQNLRFGVHDAVCVKASSSGDFHVTNASYPNCINEWNPEPVCPNDMRKNSAKVNYPCDSPNNGMTIKSMYLLLLGIVTVVLYI